MTIKYLDHGYAVEYGNASFDGGVRLMATSSLGFFIPKPVLVPLAKFLADHAAKSADAKANATPETYEALLDRAIRQTTPNAVRPKSIYASFHYNSMIAVDKNLVAGRGAFYLTLGSAKALLTNAALSNPVKIRLTDGVDPQYVFDGRLDFTLELCEQLRRAIEEVEQRTKPKPTEKTVADHYRAHLRADQRPMAKAPLPPRRTRGYFYGVQW